MAISRHDISTTLLHPSTRSRISLAVFVLMSLLSLYSIGYFQPQLTAAHRPVDTLSLMLSNAPPIGISQFFHNPLGMAAMQTSRPGRIAPQHESSGTAQPPMVEIFPIAAMATSPADLPQIPLWNRPPKTHVTQSTPLLIGFTQNWPLLQQTIASYITAGWPPGDIYVRLTLHITLNIAKFQLGY